MKVQAACSPLDRIPVKAVLCKLEYAAEGYAKVERRTHGPVDSIGIASSTH
jgi:hypothetical protein